VLVAVPFVLAACTSAGDGQALAQQACVHVNRSLDAWANSLRAGTPATAVTDLQNRATQELRLALPLAAAANSDDGTWNSLMTTISEIGTIDEGHLVPSLRATCKVADSNQNINPQSPSGNSGGGGGSGRNSPPTGNVNPKPAS
jgi:hypothetical protein